MKPVRANVLGTRDDQAMRTVRLSPGGTAASSGTSATVASSGFPSSGEMWRSRAVRSTSLPSAPATTMLVTSIQPQSSAGRCSASVLPARRRSRIHVEALFRHAL